MKPTNVLYVIWALETGGAEQVVIALARGLPRHKYRATVCCLNWEGKLAARLKSDGISVISLGKKPGLDHAIVPKLMDVMRERQIDLVHTHLWTSNFWGRIAARLAGVKAVVATEHNVDVWKSRWHFAVDKLLARATDRVIYVSDTVQNFYLSKTGVGSPKGLRIHNGIDTESLVTGADGGPLRAELGIDPGAQVVTTIGRLVPQKGHRIFVEAMRQVRAECPRAVGLIVGDGECRADLERQIRESGLEDTVILAGLRSDVPAILETSDLFVLSSYREGFPISILEAMAVGRPCVVTDVGGNREGVVDAETGYLSQPGDPAELARPIVRLLQDDELRRTMGQAAQRRVNQLFSVDAMVEQTTSLYEGLLAPGNPPE